MIYKNNKTKIRKKNIEPNNKLNKQIKAINYKEIKQDFALMGHHRAPLEN